MYSIFEKLLKEHNITAYKVSKDTGIPYSALSEWKSGRSTPKQDKLIKIADYFGVTIEHLMGREEEEQENRPYYLNQETVELLKFLRVNDKLRILFDATRQLEPSDIEFVLDMVKRLNDKRQ